ncbi:hypothetical protein DRE_06194 [Drechslerella stenobrocha 248]|uniref:Protein PBN1 n=1 Tax=Drechslerella stenobrocha 248 TaxID=1043628 RepID=W7I7V8_9PEZI|nr:hypothetical protein DRE_06194 [Drechslerella stenobrocha 248]
MKRRVTFITPPGKEIPDDALRLTKGGLEVKNLRAIREEQFTFAFEDLPQFVRDIVRQTHELHIHFDSGKDHASGWKGPFPSRLPLGVHIFAAPLGQSKMGNLCSFLSKYANTPCDSIENSFTQYGRSRQFYTPDPAVLSAILRTLGNKVCESTKRGCKEDMLQLQTASSVDIKYNATSQELDVHALWGSYSSGNTKEKAWDISVVPQTPSSRVEVGVFSRGDPVEAEEISLHGKIAVVGDDEELKPALFSISSRHHSTGANIYTADFQQPPGLHPKLETTIALGGASPADECTLNAYFTVPQPFFVDPYQLEDAKLMKSYGISNVRVVEGETDLEAPVWAVTKWGAVVVAELDTQDYFENRVKDRLPMEFTLPLHLRYLPSHPEKTNQTATLPWPTVFWACRAESGDKMATNPFDRKMLGYEEYFPEQTYFYHITPKLFNRTLSTSSLEVPILNSRYSQAIEWGTIGVVVIGFAWVLAKVVLSLLGSGSKQAGGHEKKE